MSMSTDDQSGLVNEKGEYYFFFHRSQLAKTQKWCKVPVTLKDVNMAVRTATMVFDSSILLDNQKEYYSEKGEIDEDGMVSTFVQFPPDFTP